MAKHPSDSDVQLRAESELVRALATTLKFELVSSQLVLDDCRIQIDGLNEKRRVACEAFARLGELKAGQKRKLGSDILKLLMLERVKGGEWRKILVVAGEETAAWLSGSSWQARAVREFSIEVFRVPLERALATALRNRQEDQVMMNAVRPDV